LSKNYKGPFILFVTLLVLLGGVLGGSLVLARGSQQQGSPTHPVGSGKSATAAVVAMHVIDMSAVPAEKPRSSSHRPVALPLRTGVSPAVYAQRKAAAAHSQTRVDHSTYPVPTGGTYTPTASKKFQGMSDSASICPYFGGCQPPDMALAASPSWVLEGVNTSFAVYSPTGVLQAGWPKTAQSFFGVPNPGICDPHGPFLSDPRAFYDPNDKRFWVAELQVEGAFGLNACPFQTLYWIAVSQTSDPRGLWNIYAFNMALGTTNAADYTQFGFDQQAIYFSGNMYNQAGTAYKYAEIFGAKKSSMESGLAVTAFGFFGLSVSASTTVLVDTVQPVEAQAPAYGGPSGGLFINSFNMNGDPSGHNCFSTACVGLAIWALAKPGTSSTSLSFAFVNTLSYILAPNADEPGCTACIETFDTGISGTPPYHNGLISYGLEEGLGNGSQIVPCVFWGQVTPALNDAGALTGASLYQEGDYCYSGDGSASFGTLMPDAIGDLFMVFEFMSSGVNPEVAYTARRVALAPGVFHDGGLILRKGDAPTFDSRWGDFEATSYDGSTKDDVWFAGEYSNSGGDWSTFIGKDKYCATCN
jgi:hypothetical protein